MEENLTKAIHDVSFLNSDLQECLKKANGVESIILLDLIERGNKLQMDLEHFSNMFNRDK